MKDLLIHFATMCTYCLAMVLFVTVRHFLRKHPGVAMPIIILLVLLLPVAAFASGSDHTLENWLLLIGIMLCWLKG